MYELPGLNDFFEGSVELKVDVKTVKTFLATHQEVIINSESNETLSFTKKKILLEQL